MLVGFRLERGGLFRRAACQVKRSGYGRAQIAIGRDTCVRRQKKKKKKPRLFIVPAIVSFVILRFIYEQS